MIGIGHWEIVLIAFVAFLLFGNRLPGLMNSAGSCLRNFREGMEGSTAGQDTNGE
jgi:TatA/E family protein of Tat protein translocase